MKEKSNYITSKEQSKTILKCGVSAETADLAYKYIGKGETIVINAKDPRNTSECVPCWSVGAFLDAIHEFANDNEIYDIKNTIYDITLSRQKSGFLCNISAKKGNYVNADDNPIAAIVQSFFEWYDENE